MNGTTVEAQTLRAVISRHREDVDAVLLRYGARNPRLFGSVARGDSTADSDIDLLVDLDPNGGNPVLRVAGIAEELSELLGVRVDVVAEGLLRQPVAQTVSDVIRSHIFN